MKPKNLNDYEKRWNDKLQEYLESWRESSLGPCRSSKDAHDIVIGLILADVRNDFVKKSLIQDKIDEWEQLRAESRNNIQRMYRASSIIVALKSLLRDDVK